jgi:hypothetical protein
MSGKERIMEESKLKEVIKKHSFWLAGKGGEIADLSGADLRRANLSEADLRGADLRGADLSEADLSRANLSRANLSRANLSRANLSGANLRRANLSEANLSGANLRRANLSEANLSGADLRWANLSGADLRWANLSRANLDFFCWPLWCGSLDVKLDVKQKRQLLYHVLSVCPEYRTPELIEEANKFHRIGEVPRLCQKGKQNENNKP